jgi:hypothetical protein
MTKSIISTTARQTGFGSDRFKTVTHLTKTEREGIKNGTLNVYYDSGRKSGGSHGSTWRTVKYNRGYFNPVAIANEDAMWKEIEASN